MRPRTVLSTPLNRNKPIVPAALALALIALSCGSSSAAPACVCTSEDPRERLEQATSVFVGRLLEIPENLDTGERGFVFEVIDQFKGEERETFTLNDIDRGTPCERPVKEGEFYLVFAHWEWGLWKTSTCWGTKPLKSASAHEAETLGLPNAAKEKLYEQLRTRCMGLYTTTCCLASVNAMRENYYAPEPAGGCPGGTRPDQLSCVGGYRWCVPLAQALRHEKKRNSPKR